MITLDNNVGGYLVRAFAEGHAVHAYIVEGDKAYIPDLLKQCATITICPTHSICGCDVCQKVADDNHQDVIKLPRDNRARLKVEDIAYLVEESSLRPVDNSLARVFLIDATSSTSGIGTDLWQNKLLKTIEEPTENTYIFIGVTDADGLLATIRSRCQTLKQTRLNSKVIANELKRRGYDFKTCQMASVMANGSLQMAEKIIADNGIFDAYNTALDALENMLSTKVALPYVSRMANNKANIAHCLAFMTVLLGQSLHYRIAPELFELTSLKQSIEKICTNYSIQASRVCIEKINSAKKSLDDGCNLNVVLDNLVSSILEVRYRCRL